MLKFSAQSPVKKVRYLEKRLGFWASALALPATCERNFFFETWLFAKIVLKNFSLPYLASPEIFGVEFCNRQTDRQSHKFLDTIYGWVSVFFSSQNFLPPYSLRSQGINDKIVYFQKKDLLNFF
jgi:hypothetical protein